MEKVMVGMSGGVDSSVAAALLKESGYSVCGVTFRLWEQTEGEIVQNAHRVCEALKIEHRVLDLRKTFRENVVESFAEGYLSGRTPNPCVVCNRAIKFGAFSDYASANGAEHISTGHYARVTRRADGRFMLLRGEYLPKDQSYFLYRITQRQLSMLLLPLSGMDKGWVRKKAAELGLPCAASKDSQDICFIPDGDHAAFIRSFTGAGPAWGRYIDEDGRELGKNEGAFGYTLGQRKGLGIALGRPAFVCGVDTEANTVTLTTDESRLLKRKLRVADINMVSAESLTPGQRAQVKIRSAHTPAWAVVTPLPEGQAEVLFDEPQRAPAPGQSAVFYDGDILLGGGYIAGAE